MEVVYELCASYVVEKSPECTKAKTTHGYVGLYYGGTDDDIIGYIKFHYRLYRTFRLTENVRTIHEKFTAIGKCTIVFCRNPYSLLINEANPKCLSVFLQYLKLLLQSKVSLPALKSLMENNKQLDIAPVYPDHVTLSDNYHGQYDKSIFKNNTTKTLVIRKNSIRSFNITPDLSTLHTLCIVDNPRLISISPNLFAQLPCLEFLDLSNNSLYFLPHSIGKPTKLKYLWVSNNKLISLPRTIGLLHNLLVFVEFIKELKINNNYLQYLTEGLLDLHLDLLDISQNPLKKFLCGIRELENNLRSMVLRFLLNRSFIFLCRGVDTSMLPPAILHNFYENSFQCRFCGSLSQTSYKTCILSMSLKSISREVITCNDTQEYLSVDAFSCDRGCVDCANSDLSLMQHHPQ